jgi:hypothetical protein
MVRYIVLAGLLWVPAAGLAQQPSSAPLGSPPSVVLARAVSKDGNVSLVVNVLVPVAEEVLERIQLERGSAFMKRVVVRTKMVEQVHVVDGKLVSVVRKNGKSIAVRELPRLLEKPTAVVMFQGKIDPFYLQVLHDNVLIVQVPEPQPLAPAPVLEEKPAPKGDR